MSLLLQECLVGLLVLGCALFSAWRLSSLRLRLLTLDRLSRWQPLRRAAWLARSRARLLARQSQACGGCAGAGPATPGVDASNRTPGALRR